MSIERLIEGLKAHQGESVLLDIRRGSIDLFKQDIEELEVYENVINDEKYLLINNKYCEDWEGISIKGNDIESIEQGVNSKSNGLDYYIRLHNINIKLYQEV